MTENECIGEWGQHRGRKRCESWRGRVRTPSAPIYAKRPERVLGAHTCRQQTHVAGQHLEHIDELVEVVHAKVVNRGKGIGNRNGLRLGSRLLSRSGSRTNGRGAVKQLGREGVLSIVHEVLE